MAPQPRAQTSPPKPWEQQRVALPDKNLAPTSYIACPATGGGGGGGVGVGAGQHYPRSSSLRDTGPDGVAVAAAPQASTTNGDYSRRNALMPGGNNNASRYASLQRGGAASAVGPTGVAGGSSGARATSAQGATASRQENGTSGVAGAAQVTGEVVVAAGTTDNNGAANAAGNGFAGGQQWKQQQPQQQQQQGLAAQGSTGAYGGAQSSGYGGVGYGASRYGAGTGITTGYGTGGYGSSYGSGFGGTGYGGYGGYSGGMYGGGGYGSSYGGYGSSYGGYGSRYGMGGMGMGAGGMGMGGGMGGMHEQYSWLHSIQQFTSSLGYLTEMLGMNTQAIGFVFGNLMAFLEHIGNSLTSIQPWREFPPGHPRHGEPPPTPEEERRRLSRLRVLRFALTIVIAYAGFRLSRALHRLITGRYGNRPRVAIAQASLEHIYRQQEGGRRGGALDRGRRSAEALLPRGPVQSGGTGPTHATAGQEAWSESGSRTSSRTFDSVDPWNEF